MAARLRKAQTGCLLANTVQGETTAVRHAYFPRLEGVESPADCGTDCGLDIRGYFRTATVKGQVRHPADLFAIGVDGRYVQLLHLQLNTTAADAPLDAFTEVAKKALTQLRTSGGGDPEPTAAPSAPAPTAHRPDVGRLRLLDASQLPTDDRLDGMAAGKPYVDRPRNTDDDEAPCPAAEFATDWAAQMRFGDDTQDDGRPALHQWGVEVAAANNYSAEDTAGGLAYEILRAQPECALTRPNSESRLVRWAHVRAVKGADNTRNECYDFCGLEIRGYFRTETVDGRVRHSADLLAVGTDGPYVQVIHLRMDTTVADAPFKKFTAMAKAALAQLK